MPGCYQKRRGDRQHSSSRGRGTGGNRGPVGSANHVGVVGASVGGSAGAGQVFDAMDEHGFCLLRYVHARISVELPGSKLLALGLHAVLPDTGASASLMLSDLYETLQENAGSQPAPRLRPLRAALRAANEGEILAHGIANF